MSHVPGRLRKTLKEGAGRRCAALPAAPARPSSFPLKLTESRFETVSMALGGSDCEY